MDVSGLVKDCTGLESLQRLISGGQCSRGQGAHGETKMWQRKDEFRELSEMLNTSELETVRHYGGLMHTECQEDDESTSTNPTSNRPRLLLKEPSAEIDETKAQVQDIGKLPGVYQHVSSLA